MFYLRVHRKAERNNLWIGSTFIFVMHSAQDSPSNRLFFGWTWARKASLHTQGTSRDVVGCCDSRSPIDEVCDAQTHSHSLHVDERWETLKCAVVYPWICRFSLRMGIKICVVAKSFPAELNLEKWFFHQFFVPVLTCHCGCVKGRLLVFH